MIADVLRKFIPDFFNFSLSSRPPVPAPEPFNSIGPEELRDMLDSFPKDFLLIDARSTEEFGECHINGAINIPERKFADLLALLPSDKSGKLVFYCNGPKCGKSARSARKAAALGYRDVVVFSDGMPVWEEKGYPFYKGPGYSKWIETTKITPKQVNKLLSATPADITVVDVCDKEEYDEEHIPGAINLPLASFASGSAILDKKKKIIVYCKSGGRSHAAYRKLVALEYKKIYQLVLDNWKAAGMPVTKSDILTPGDDVPAVGGPSCPVAASKGPSVFEGGALTSAFISAFL